MFKRILWRSALTGLIAMACSLPALADQPPANDLGKSWPNAPDVSASPHWHVYVFVRDGVRYIQINDTNGNVRGAFATANGVYLVLPMGRDAQLVTTPQDAPATQPDDASQQGETVYQDSSVQVTATPLVSGAVMLNAVATGNCDPIECSSHKQ